MKKILIVLINTLIILTLVGCHSTIETPIVSTGEEEKQEIVEETPQQEVKQKEIVIEEAKEETKAVSQDITNMYFWVVFYDQFGNELQREALKYGTVPEYKSWLPEGFDKWVYKKSQKDVGTFKAITGNTYYQAVCHEVTHEESVPEVPKEPNYLYFKNIGQYPAYFYLKTEGDILPFNNMAFQYSYDKIDWLDLELDHEYFLESDETMYFKAKAPIPALYDETGDNGVYFTSSDSVEENKSLEVGGSIMTLLDPTDALRDISSYPYCFNTLFYDMDNLRNANNLVCPATKLSEYCYNEMFVGNSLLESINENLLPATDLAGADYCYYYMFENCSSLKNVPNLPATQISACCYDGMFENCKSLVTVPTDLLPAIDLTDCEYCYKYMFSGCINLKNAPNLPASILATSCYESMFNGCSLLQNLSVGFSSFESLPENATDGWLNGTSNGTFTWSGLTSIDTRNANTVPISWTIVNP